MHGARADEGAAPLAAEPAPELYACPVRRRYAWQLLRYGIPARRWRKALLDPSPRDDLERLWAVLRTAQQETRHYARAFAAAGVQWKDLGSASDLAAFPSLSRAGAQEAYLDLFSHRTTAWHLEEGWLGTTSGSVGEPVRFFMDGESIHFFTAFVRFLWRLHRLGPAPAPPRAGIVLLCTLPRSSVYQVRLPLLRFSLFRKLHWGEPEAPSTLERLAPQVVTGDPDSLSRLAEAVESGTARVRPRLILSSAFPLPEDLAERLTRATGAVVVDYYSLAETGPLAFKCTAGTGRFHLLDPAALVESERGELLVTNLRNRLFPLVRYRTGDLGSVSADAEPCRCGVRGRVLARLDGRIAARFVDASGRRVDPSKLHPLLSRLPLKQFQLVQRAEGDVVLRHYAEAQLPPGATDELARAISHLLGRHASLSLERLERPIFRPGEKPIVYRSDAREPLAGT